MKGEEYNHINDVIQDLYDDGKLSESDFDLLCKAIDASDKADKYRWHDIRKNPMDLPQTPNILISRNLVYSKEIEFVGIDCILHIGRFVHKNDGNRNVWVANDRDVEIKNVIKWRDIEPFEEEENAKLD